MSSGEPMDTGERKERQHELWRYVMIMVVITIAIVGILLVLGKMSGNIFSNIVGSL